jgi:hypothetical protein
MGDEEKDVRTDFLVARPSFWTGVGRVLDLWGKFDDYNVSRTTEEADMRALYSDWRITGQDIRDAWIQVHEGKSGYPKKRQKDERVVCVSCGKSSGDYSSGRKTARIHLKQAHGRK